MKQLSPTGLQSVLRVFTAGLIVDQRTGEAPAVSAAPVGALALDSKSGNAYTNTADGWVQIPGIDCRKFVG